MRIPIFLPLFISYILYKYIDTYPKYSFNHNITKSKLQRTIETEKYKYLHPVN